MTAETIPAEVSALAARIVGGWGSCPSPASVMQVVLEQAIWRGILADRSTRPAGPAPEVEAGDGEVVAWSDPRDLTNPDPTGPTLVMQRHRNAMFSDPLVRRSTLEAERARADAAKAENEESYELGKRDGYEQAIQRLDELTGGDGEFVCVVGVDPEDRHCPDAASMQERIVARVSRALQDRDDAVRLADRLLSSLNEIRDMLFCRPDIVEKLHPLMGFAENAIADRASAAILLAGLARLRADQPAGEGGEA